jgi:hypothetical protein
MKSKWTSSQVDLLEKATLDLLLFGKTELARCLEVYGADGSISAYYLGKKWISHITITGISPRYSKNM